MQKTKIETPPGLTIEPLQDHAERINKKVATVKACKKYRDKTEILHVFIERKGVFYDTGKTQKYIVEEN